jgi:hypothetical protein
VTNQPALLAASIELLVLLDQLVLLLLDAAAEEEKGFVCSLLLCWTRTKKEHSG